MASLAVPREEQAVVDAGGDDADAVGLGPVQADELRRLDRRRGDQPVRVRDHELLAGQAVRGFRTLAARQGVVLDLAERVERGHQGDAPDLAGAAPHPAREPVVRVDEVVVGPLRACPPQDPAQELRQEPRQLLLGHGRARSGLDVDQPGAVPELLDLGTPLVPRAGEDVHLDAARRQALGRRPDEDVHPAGVARTRLVERGRVQADHGDPRLIADRRRALAGGPFGR